MNEVKTVVGAVSFALKTARIANAVKKTVAVASIAVCGYAIYHLFSSK